MLHRRVWLGTPSGSTSNCGELEFGWACACSGENFGGTSQDSAHGFTKDHLGGTGQRMAGLAARVFSPKGAGQYADTVQFIAGWESAVRQFERGATTMSSRSMPWTKWLCERSHISQELSARRQDQDPWRSMLLTL